MKKLTLKIFTLAAMLASLIPAIPAKAGTGVYVNGQELNYSQWVSASRMVGSPIAPGLYWYDARTGTYGQLGGSNYGGDNSWNTRFSAGNSNADNSTGYVSVPGHGAIGYGM